MEICKRTLRMNNGYEIPILGIGTYKIRGRELIYKVINAALRSGYRAIDTAAVYGNEEDIGFALKELLPKYNLTRENIFITTKLAPNDHGEERVHMAVQKSLKNLGLDYIDLYLIHWPGASGVPVDSIINVNARNSSWTALVTLQKKGVLRSIGVSNYTVKHLTELLSHVSGIKPAVNQVEIHPFFRQEQLVSFCETNGILVQAYCSLGGSSGKSLLNEPTVQEICININRSPAQVLLKWAIQHGYAVIPKSVDEDRIAANTNLNFEIPKDKMELLDNLKNVVKFAWNPDIVV